MLRRLSKIGGWYLAAGWLLVTTCLLVGGIGLGAGSPAPPLSDQGSPAWHTLLGFPEDWAWEAEWPDGWWCWIAPGAPDAHWGIWDAGNFDRYHSYPGAVFCAAGGSEGVEPQSVLPDSMSAHLLYGPFTLHDAVAAELSFWYWSDGSPPTEYFYVWGIAGDPFDPAVEVIHDLGSTSGLWEEYTLDLKEVCGQSEVYISFHFLHTSGGTAEGVWIDDVTLRKQGKEWTVAVYMDADGLSAGPQMFSTDIDEMESAMVSSTDHCNTVIYVDCSGTANVIQHVRPDDEPLQLAEYVDNKSLWRMPASWDGFTYETENAIPVGATPGSGAEHNTGDPATLTGFLDWVHRNFLSDRYALIVWGDGGGWHSVCWDETHGDHLTVKELAEAIDRSSIPGSIDIVGFDADGMQMIEVAYELFCVGACNYMVGSEEHASEDGWVYDQILAGIGPSTEPHDLAVAWASTRDDGCETLSAIELAYVDELASEVSQYNTLPIESDEDLYHEMLWSNYWASAGRTEWGGVDLGTLHDPTGDVQTWIDAVVIANNVDTFHIGWDGISIYMPTGHDFAWGVPHADYTDVRLAFCAYEVWDEFVDRWLAADFDDPSSDVGPEGAYHLGTIELTPGYRYLSESMEFDFDSECADWFTFSCSEWFDAEVDVWCTGEASDTEIYLYDSLANAQADDFFAHDEDGFFAFWGYRNKGSVWGSMPAGSLAPGTYYLKVEQQDGVYGLDRDYVIQLWGQNADSPATFRVDPAGHVLADGTLYSETLATGAADVAEWVRISEPVEPGDVLELDPADPGRYRKVRGCSTRVAGVVSTEPGVVLGEGTAAAERALLALVGIVPVKACDENGPIRLGDLLVPASDPGYVMRAAPDMLSSGCIVGKALEPLHEGNGLILTLLLR